MLRLFFLSCFVSGCCLGQCAGDVYQVNAVELIDGSKVESQGSAVCVATAKSRSLLMTCKHIVSESPNNTWVAVDGKWLLAHDVKLHPTQDLATFEVDAILEPTAMGDDPKTGDEVEVVGYGPLFHNLPDGKSFTGKIDSTTDETYTLIAPNVHAMPGDSGGAVLCRKKLIGIVSWHEGPRPATTRHMYVDAHTGFVGCRTITTWYETQYGPNRCGPTGCPIQIRPQIQQPFLGPFPIGPPRVVGIAEPVPQRYVPVDDAPPFVPQPAPISVTGPRGATGPQGPPGKDGADGRSVQAAEIEATIVAWLESNRDALRGPQGPTGGSVDVTEIKARLATLENRKIRFITSKGRVLVDDETYSGSADDPIILNLDKIIKAATVAGN